jgi:hypothetical protein
VVLFLQLGRDPRRVHQDLQLVVRNAKLRQQRVALLPGKAPVQERRNSLVVGQGVHPSLRW